MLRYIVQRYVAQNTTTSIQKTRPYISQLSHHITHNTQRCFTNQAKFKSPTREKIQTNKQSQQIPKVAPNIVEMQPIITTNLQQNDSICSTVDVKSINFKNIYLLLFNIPTDASKSLITRKFSVDSKSIRFIDEETALIRFKTPTQMQKALEKQNATVTIDFRVKEAPEELLKQMYNEQCRSIYICHVDPKNIKDNVSIPMNHTKRFMDVNFGSGYYKTIDGKSFYTFDTDESLAKFSAAIKQFQHIKFRVPNKEEIIELYASHYNSMPPAIRQIIEFIKVQ